MRTSILTAVFATSLLTTGCFGACGEMAAEAITEKALGVADIDVDEKTGSVTIKGKDGEVVHMAAEGDNSKLTFKGKDGIIEYNAGHDQKLPLGFPFEVVKGSRVQGSATTSDGKQVSYMLSLASESAVDEAAAFYEKELKAKGIEVQRTDMNVDGKQFVTLGGKAEDREATLAISTGEEGQGSLTQFSVRTPKK